MERANHSKPQLMFYLFQRALALALFSCSFALCHQASARTIYVAPGGSGSGAISAPLGDVSRAARAAGAGDKIVLRGGVYDLQKGVYLDKPGVSLVGFRGEKPVLRAPSDESSPVASVVVVTAPRVLVSGLEIRGGSYYGLKIDVDEAKTPARGVIVRGCRIGATGRDCVKTFNADQLLIESCNIGPSGLRDPSNAEGIDSIGSRGVKIRNCFVHDIATNGIYFKGGTTDGVVEGCHLQNMRFGSGILLGQDTDAEFMRDGTPFEARRCVARNNIVSGAAGSGVGTFSGENIRFENNTLLNVARQSGAGLWVVVNRRGVASRGVSFNRNIVVQSGARPFVFLQDMAGTLAAQNNLYFSTGNAGVFRIERQRSVRNLPLSVWRAAIGGDSGSRIANPLVDSARGYKPRAGSPALGRGVRIGAR